MIQSELTRQYLAGLKKYLADRSQNSLHQASRLGRRTMAGGLGVIDMARIHEDVLLAVLPESEKKQDTLQVAKGAGAFLTESMSAFELAHRGFQEANLTLRRLNKEAEDRASQLAEANRELKKEITERKRAEKALRESEEHYRVLFNQTRRMRDNLRHLSSQILHVQEEERKRISRELHDEVGQALTAINVSLALLEKSVKGRQDQLRRRATDARRLLEQTMKTVHDFSSELRPAMLDDLGLAPALRSFVRNFATRTGIRLALRAGVEAEKLADEQKTVLYRVVQEGLTNIARHARATRGSVRIGKHKKGIYLEIKDNGKAFQVNQKLSRHGRKRLGLLGIQERVRLANGLFHIKSAPGRGTNLHIWLPFRMDGIDRLEKQTILQERAA